MATETSTEKLIKGALIHTANIDRRPIEVRQFNCDVVGVLSDEDGYPYIIYFNKKKVGNKFAHEPTPILVYYNEKGEVTDRAGNIRPEFSYLIDVDFMIRGWRDWNEVEDDVHKLFVNITPIEWDEDPTSVDLGDYIN